MSSPPSISSLPQKLGENANMEIYDTNQESKPIARTCTCTLRKFPPELRNTIFELSMATDTARTDYPSDPSDQTHKDNNYSLIKALRPCSDLYHEALDVFWTLSPLIHDIASWKAFGKLGDTAVESIKSLTFNLSIPRREMTPSDYPAVHYVLGPPPNINLALNFTALTFKVTKVYDLPTLAFLYKLLTTCPRIRKLTCYAVVTNPSELLDDWGRLRHFGHSSIANGTTTITTKTSRAVFTWCYSDMLQKIDGLICQGQAVPKEVYTNSEENDDPEIWTWDTVRKEVYTNSNENDDLMEIWTWEARPGKAPKVL